MGHEDNGLLVTCRQHCTGCGCRGLRACGSNADSGRRTPTSATIAWIFGLVLIVPAAVTEGTLRSIRAILSQWREWRSWGLTLLAILIVALVLRTYSLDNIPGFIHNDEANDGLQARAIAAGQVHTLFTISSWSQLPMLIHAWYALFLIVFGDNLVSQRMGSVVLGLLSIVIVALLGKELFSTRAGLIAATLETVYHFHIHFSRVGIQIISGDVAVPLTFYCLIRTIRYGSRLAAVFTGILLTLDLHAYFGSRICYIVLPLFVFPLMFTGYRALLMRRLYLLSWIALGYVVSIAPLGVYIFHNWEDFTHIPGTKPFLVLRLIFKFSSPLCLAPTYFHNVSYGTLAHCANIFRHRRCRYAIRNRPPNARSCQCILVNSRGCLCVVPFQAARLFIVPHGAIVRCGHWRGAYKLTCRTGRD